MADLDLRARTPSPRRASTPALPAGLAGASRLASERLWPVAKTLARPLGLYLASRVVVYVAIGVVIMLHIGISTQHFTGPWPAHSPGRPLLEALGTWDGSWYMRIASHGYTTALNPPTSFTASSAFLPALPVLLRISQAVTGLNMLYAAVLTSFVVGAVASICVWLFVRHLTDVATADRGTALWCFFPGAVTLSLVYAEGLLVVFAVVCLYALLRGRWLIAGIAAAGASATSPEGLALLACCAWAAGAAILATRKRAAQLAGGDGATNDDGAGPAFHGSAWRRRAAWTAPLVAPLLAPMGWLAYQAYLWRRTGDLTFWYQVEKRFWNGGFHPRAVTVTIAHLAFDHPGIPNYVIPTLGLFVLAAAAVALWYWKPPAVVTIYAAVIMVLVLSSGVLGARPAVLHRCFPPRRGPRPARPGHGVPRSPRRLRWRTCVAHVDSRLVHPGSGFRPVTPATKGASAIGRSTCMSRR